jgi:hypothetical protein
LIPVNIACAGMQPTRQAPERRAPFGRTAAQALECAVAFLRTDNNRRK